MLNKYDGWFYHKVNGHPPLRSKCEIFDGTNWIPAHEYVKPSPTSGTVRIGPDKLIYVD